MAETEQIKETGSWEYIHSTNDWAPTTNKALCQVLWRILRQTSNSYPPQETTCDSTLWNNVFVIAHFQHTHRMEWRGGSSLQVAGLCPNHETRCNSELLFRWKCTALCKMESTLKPLRSWGGPFWTREESGDQSGRLSGEAGRLWFFLKKLSKKGLSEISRWSW